ncbi:hypothetical protein ES288_A12G220000v1 [Gossypium darwinii]|uniref:Uncharacterized protein n=1 Tax=Gossypium darwinii TaxID=34276 RepID=A0A5D2ECC1_GOSDA|nr:hypothetical protein ES288_A12G220000v1 [Gossypium darwinii]
MIKAQDEPITIKVAVSKMGRAEGDPRHDRLLAIKDWQQETFQPCVNLPKKQGQGRKTKTKAKRRNNNVEKKNTGSIFSTFGAERENRGKLHVDSGTSKFIIFSISMDYLCFYIYL